MVYNLPGPDLNTICAKAKRLWWNTGQGASQIRQKLCDEDRKEINVSWKAQGSCG